MKKILILMLIAGFACSPLIQSSAQAGGAGAKGKANAQSHHKVQAKKQQVAKAKQKLQKKKAQLHAAKAAQHGTKHKAA